MAASYATRKMAMPLLDLLDCIRSKGKKASVRLFEDNQFALAIIDSGRNPTMPHISRTHGISIASLHEFWQRPCASYVYETSA